jgi:hypothetical protein
MENNYINIDYMGKTEKVLSYLSETKIQFQKRLEYIKKLENNKINWKEANRLSKIWFCIKFKNCKYIPEVYHLVTKYDK